MNIFFSIIVFAIPALLVFGVHCNDEQVETAKNFIAGTLTVLLTIQLLVTCGVDTLWLF